MGLGAPEEHSGNVTDQRVSDSLGPSPLPIV